MDDVFLMPTIGYQGKEYMLKFLVCSSSCRKIPDIDGSLLIRLILYSNFFFTFFVESYCITLVDLI